MEKFVPNPAIHIKAVTERDRNAFQKLKLQHVKLIIRSRDMYIREAAYTGLQLVCFALDDEDLPPLTWFPYPANLRKPSLPGV